MEIIIRIKSCTNYIFYFQLYSAFQQEERTVTEMNQYARELEFCSFNKHQHLKVPENERKKIKTETGNSGWYFGICNKRIPDKRVTKVCFKVTGQEKEAFILGIGSKDIMRQNNFYDCQKQGRGTYILMNYEGFFNHQGQKREAFKFWPNDVIMIEVDMNLKFIRWTKKDTRDGFATKLVLEGELYFCVGLWYRDQSIQILNDFF
ncbi:unnamed protein product [Paramecium sonneborni]|uniref:SPRY domain-containing protein n=1 Tax=Paramecium sonneborni TaxID=65129 RepID=A0A8S1R002_9CILI|nr:unnamed protein product [Paramecium sonneborni]